MWILNELDFFLELLFRCSARDAARAVLDSRYGKGQWEIVWVPRLGEVVYLRSESQLLRDMPVMQLQARARACELTEVLTMPKDATLRGILDFKAFPW